MSNKLSQQEFQDLIRKLIKENFNKTEFKGPAMKAAKKDIEADGDKFIPIGKSKFEKDLDIEKLMKSLKEENYEFYDDYSNNDDSDDDYEVNPFLDTDVPGMMAAHQDVKKHMKTDVDLGGYYIEPTEDEIKDIIRALKITHLNLPSDIDIFRTAKKLLNRSLKKGDIDKIKRKMNNIGFSINEWNDEDEGPQPGDAEYHNEQPKPLRGIGRFNHIDWQILWETLEANTEYMHTGKVASNPNYMEAGVNDLTDAEGMLSYEELQLLENHDIIEIHKHYPVLTDDFFRRDYQNFYNAAQNAWTKGFSKINNDNYAEKEAAYFRGSEGPGMDEGTANINRPMDAEGKPMTLKARVEDLETKAVGRILRFGVDDNNQMTVHVEWISQFGGKVPQTITYPNKIVVKDSAKKTEEEIEEGMGQSHTVGRGQNIKPGNYPQTLKRKGMNENLDQAIQKNDQEVFLVIDNDFNRAHYKDLIGQTFEDAPGYAQVKVVNKSEVPQLASEDFDYVGSEIEHMNKTDLTEYVGKNIIITNKDEMENLIFGNHIRIKSIYSDLREQLDNNYVQNNKVVASDNMDTQWIFEILNADDKTVTLEFQGTAK